MIRALHRWPGLVALALITILALSGAVLAVFPAAERLSSPQVAATDSVADVATRIMQNFPGVEQIKRAPSGRITAYWFENDKPGAAIIDPTTGDAAGSADPNGFEIWLTNLHRSLFLDDGGRMVMAAGAAAMLVLAMSGAVLVARRTGGWRNWFRGLRGPLAGRIHVELARVAMAGLVLSSATALWMTASTFGLLPDGAAVPPFPAQVSGTTGAPVSGMDILKTTPAASLRELTFPYPGDKTDVFTLKTSNGTGYIDQGTGELLGWTDLGSWERISETIYMLHTGQGAATLGLILGLMALAIPAMGVTGVAIWLAGRRTRVRIRGNKPARLADTVILVGSEGGSTWGFAGTLHKALTDQGLSVHVNAMSGFDASRYERAERILVLAATYGDGDAPASARGFAERFANSDPLPGAKIAVLGFGDSSFPAYCAFANEVATIAHQSNWPELLPYDTIDRQSPQEFARWGRALGKVLGIELELVHRPAPQPVQSLTLVSRRDYGHEVQAPTAILRFAIPQASFWKRLARSGFAHFKAGDLIGIVPDGSDLPRFYSLASGTRDGFVEIVVRKHPGGLCSGQLMALEPGDMVQAFHRRNRTFQPSRGSAPLVLIGAGTGIGPLAGFIRANKRRRPVSLFFGMRHPRSDFLYHDELAGWQSDGRLSRLFTTSSRGEKPRYVQEALQAEAAELARLVRNGAMIMVCGGREMAAGVSETLGAILAQSGMSTASLKAEGRYVEDVY